MGQEAYLRGVTLVRRPYRPNPANPMWDHDHCEFCGAEFSAAAVADVLHSGYCTPDEYRWICEQCFQDFRAEFQWQMLDA